jgi:putative endonuclease
MEGFFVICMQKYYTYIIYSELLDRMYFGQSQDLEKRLQKHNSGQVPSTKCGIPWILLYYSSHEDRSEAMKEEKRWKNVKSRVRVLERIAARVSKDQGIVLDKAQFEKFSSNN